MFPSPPRQYIRKLPRALMVVGTLTIVGDAHADCDVPCAYDGRCTRQDNTCVATSPLDCQQSLRCTAAAECWLNRDDQICDDGTEPDVALYASGIVLMGLGATAVIVSGVFLLPCISPLAGDDTCVHGLITWGSGVALLGAGVPMFHIGTQKEPRDGVPSLEIGTSGATLTWTF